jgi:hypothetical protein
MKSSRSLPGLLVVLGACQGMIADAPTYEARELQTFFDDGAESSAHSAAGSGAVSLRDPSQPMAAAADSGHAMATPVPATTREHSPRQDADDAGAPVAPEPRVEIAAPGAATALRVGDGDMARPIDGPAPVDAAKLGGAPFTLVKNWDFGSEGTIKDQRDLDAEFQYHDQFGTIANGSNYGAVTVASNTSCAIRQSGLGLSDDSQPVENPARPTREFTATSLLTHVRPLSDSQTSVSADRHDAGNGSFTAKWSLPNGGELLGHDVVWETRVRMPKPVPGYWFALWNAGKMWDKGAEMDVLESFGTPNISADAFHSDSVGGSNTVDYKSWPNGLDSAGVPSNDRELSAWHIWTWIYRSDDSYEVYYDGYQVQHGSIHWTHGATPDGEPIDMWFLFDFSWGHTQVPDVHIELPASQFPLTYEIDYSRVYMR